MLTAVAREVRKRNPEAMIHIISAYPEVFARNPDVDFVSLRPRQTKPWLRKFMVRNTLAFPWTKHFLYYLCRAVNIRDEIDLRNYLYPDEKDWAFARQTLSELGSAPVLLARTSNSNQHYRKTWPTGSWLRLVRQLLPFAPVVDVGVLGPGLDISDSRYLNLLGRTTFHQLAALIGKASALVTMDSAPNHIAAAFDTPTICILGGVFPPVAIQYPTTCVLAKRPACRDCWPQSDCAHGVKCLSDIGVDEVLTGLRQICPTLFRAQTEFHPVSTPTVCAEF